MNKPDCEHRYTAGEVADITGAVPGTLRRWVMDGYIVEHDYLYGSCITRRRIDRAGDGPIRGSIIRRISCGENDAVRLLAVGFMPGRAGWDRNCPQRYRPLAEPGKKQPRWLCLWLDGEVRAVFGRPLYAASSVAMALGDHPVATILGLETLSAGADLLLRS